MMRNDRETNGEKTFEWYPARQKLGNINYAIVIVAIMVICIAAFSEEFSGFGNVIDGMRRETGRRRERVSRWNSAGILLIERQADPRRGCERSRSTLE